MEYWFKIVDSVENVLPLEGPLAVPTRAAIGAGIGYLVYEAFRPSWAYNPDGSRRPDAMMPALYSANGPPTATPFWTGPLLGALALTLFI
jgi:hypothetical protein